MASIFVQEEEYLSQRPNLMMNQLGGKSIIF